MVIHLKSRMQLWHLETERAARELGNKRGCQEKLNESENKKKTTWKKCKTISSNRVDRWRMKGQERKTGWRTTRGQKEERREHVEINTGGIKQAVGSNGRGIEIRMDAKDKQSKGGKNRDGVKREVKPWCRKRFPPFKNNTESDLKCSASPFSALCYPVSTMTVKNKCFIIFWCNAFFQDSQTLQCKWFQV